MKGIIIHGNPMWGDNERATYCEFINEAAFELKQNDSRMIISSLEGEASKSSKAVCSKDDTYDFETGALIALMKMCGVDKVVRACNEAFSEDTFKTYATKYERELNELKKEVKRLTNVSEGFYEFNGRLINEIDQKNHEIISLKALKISNESLKKDNELFRKTCEKLKDENSLLRNKNNELAEKKKDLKKKLNAMYGYIDTDNVKPELPRTLDINGVTYRKGVSLKDLSKTFEINNGFMITGWDPEKDFVEQLHKLGGITEFTFDTKPLTKRKQMWNAIKNFKYNSCIEVDKADAVDFLEDLEKEMPNVHWVTGPKPSSIKPMFNCRNNPSYDKIYFFIDGTYVTYGFSKDTARGPVQYVTYFPPMRWDLFEKGRIIVGVRRDQYNDFKDEITHRFGLTNQHKPYEDFNNTFYMYDKKANFIEALGRSQFKEIKRINGHKVVYWEDVR